MCGRMDIVASKHSDSKLENYDSIFVVNCENNYYVSRVVVASKMLTYYDSVVVNYDRRTF